MKKLISLLLAVTMLLGVVSLASAEGAAYKVAMITDSGDITDQSFNQTTYEACKAFCEANNVDFTYFKPAGDSDAERIAQVENAIDQGYNVVVMPGYLFAPAIAETAELYPDVTYIALDVSKDDLNGAGLTEIPANVYCAVYQEELSGYMAGYATVKLGYTHLGFLGGMAVPAVVRFGYGYVQGADAAAQELGVDIAIECAYGNQFYGDADITAAMDNWYQNMGVQVVFACGGGIYTSAAEAAVKVEGTKVIGVDTDQSFIINERQGNLTLTSAMKGLAPTVDTMLTETVLNNNFAAFGGKVDTLGLVSENPAENYVQLPAETTLWGDGFTEEDYNALVGKMFRGEITVSNAIDAMPAVSEKTTVTDYGNLK